jgi:hypothetical protein
MLYRDTYHNNKVVKSRQPKTMMQDFDYTMPSAFSEHSRLSDGKFFKGLQLDKIIGSATQLPEIPDISHLDIGIAESDLAMYSVLGEVEAIYFAVGTYDSLVAVAAYYDLPVPINSAIGAVIDSAHSDMFFTDPKHGAAVGVLTFEDGVAVSLKMHLMVEFTPAPDKLTITLDAGK